MVGTLSRQVTEHPGQCHVDAPAQVNCPHWGRSGSFQSVLSGAEDSDGFECTALSTGARWMWPQFLDSKWPVQGADTFSFPIHRPVLSRPLNRLPRHPRLRSDPSRSALGQFGRSLLLDPDRGQNHPESCTMSHTPHPRPIPSESDFYWGRRVPGHYWHLESISPGDSNGQAGYANHSDR